jgi:APA family basic amino acid/polyamine antiporter
VPAAPCVPLLSIAACFGLMLGLPLETWIRFVVWLGIGLLIYWFFGRKHSEFAEHSPAGRIR